MNLRHWIVVGVAVSMACTAFAGDDAKNVRTFDAGYEDTWQATLQAVTVDLDLKVKTLEKESGLIQFDSEGTGGNYWGDANELVKNLTTRKVKALSLWSGFLLDCNVLVENKSATRTTITLNTSIQGFGGWKEQWVALESNGTIEKQFFEAIENRLNAKLARAGSAEPATTETAGATPPAATGHGMIDLTSAPSGADVEVDGAFVGQTPATLKLVGGTHTISVSHKGHESWSRELTVIPGSSLNLKAELEKR